ncbi:MAG: phosphodiester glycosidase family protein [Actinomycetales bacterium]
MSAPTLNRPAPHDDPEKPAGGSRLGRRAFLGGVAAIFAGAGGAGAWAADRYLLDKVAVAGTSTITAENVSVAEAAADGQFTSTGYRSDTAKIDIATYTTGSGSSTVTGYVATIEVSDATIVRSAFAGDNFGQSITADPSTIAAQVGAALAINGDYYGFRTDGIVVRNGVAYRDVPAREGLALYSDGTMRLYDETTTSADALVADGAWCAWSFGPGLVENGSIRSGIESIEVDTNFGNHSVQGNQPRTGIGMIEPNTFLMIVVDGRSSGYSRGVTMTEFAQIFLDQEAQVAYNLDGGGSSTMVLDDTLVNNPLGRGQERGTSDIIYVAG